MGISLAWFKEMFKSEREKQKEELEIELLKQQLISKEGVKKDSVVKPYLSLRLINNVLIITLTDGNILSKPNATTEDFNKARKCTTEQELLKIASSSEGLEEKYAQEAEIKKTKAIIDGVQTLKDLEDFQIVGNAVYLKGTGRSLPPLLVEKFAQLAGNNAGSYVKLESTEEYLALKRFFLWCCLNPRAEVADKLYNFLVENSFRITKQGFFVALRNVVTVPNTGNKELVKFVSNAYQKVKAVWKKKPTNFEVYKDGDGEFGITDNVASPSFQSKNNQVIGNLQDLYLELPTMEENRFTDAHTRTFDIRIGKVVNMPPEECSWSTRDCAEAGLHFTSDQIHYVGCGDTSVLMLINPMKVVGIGAHKGRCYEYLPIMTVDADEATKILHDLDFDTLELDEDFVVRELENLAVKAKEGFSKEAKKYEFNLPELSSVQLNNIVASLEDMKSAISKRVAVLD